MILTLRTAVIGIGNPLMGDDGIGPLLIEGLRSSGVSGADLIDLGTGGIRLVHEMARYDRVIIVDAADMGLDPGEHRIFSPEDAISVKFNRGYSLHDWDVMRSIEISKELGETPPSITIFAIQPGSVGSGDGLSSALEKRIGGYLEDISDLLRS
jgi:hydrogenase maturation protease